MRNFDSFQENDLKLVHVANRGVLKGHGTLIIFIELYYILIYVAILSNSVAFCSR